MALVDLPVRDLLARFSASDPTPGGGSAAALSSAIGASLLMMVAALPKTRSGTDEDRARLADAGGQLSAIRDRLAAAIDEDTAAYDAVVAAYRLPKGSPEEQAARKAAIQRALRAATEVPLGVVRLSADALARAAAIAAHGHRGAASDVGVAIALLRAGAEGARLNVDINVGGLADAAYADDARRACAAASQASASAAADADRLLGAG
jgi:methenyltetrahydrofolate cyclohydrolase